MRIKIYEGEKFERGKARYWIFILIVVSLLVVSVAFSKYRNIEGAIVLSVMFGAYLYFLAKAMGETELVLEGNTLSLGKKKIPLSLLKGFLIEMNAKTGVLQNIVLVYEKKVEIYSFNDNLEAIEAFAQALSERLPMLESYPQTTMERFMRKLKL